MSTFVHWLSRTFPLATKRKFLNHVSIFATVICRPFGSSWLLYATQIHLSFVDDFCVIVFLLTDVNIYSSHPCSTNIVPSLHRQPIMSQVPLSLATCQFHPCSTNMLPSLHRQPIMSQVPLSLATCQFYPCSTNMLPSLHRQPIMSQVPLSLATCQFHPCSTNMLPSLHRQPIMFHVPDYLRPFIFFTHSTNSSPSLPWMAFVTYMNHHLRLNWFRSYSSPCNNPSSNFSVNLFGYSTFWWHSFQEKLIGSYKSLVAVVFTCWSFTVFQLRNKIITSLSFILGKSLSYCFVLKLIFWFRHFLIKDPL